jgi:hypothetical protein
MTEVRIAIFARDGTQLTDVQSDLLPRDTETDFRGILSILDPMAAQERPFLFTMTLGPFHVDVCFESGRFVFSIIAATAPPSLVSVNPIFAWAAGRAFSQLIGDQPDAPAARQASDAFSSLLPRDPLNSVHRIISRVRMAGVNYVAFVAQGHRVFLSLGETKMSPDRFIFAWCACLEAFAQLEEQPIVAVPEQDNLVVTHFVPFVRMAVFFVEKATQARIQGFVAELERVKADLAGLFAPREYRPQMPAAPKEGGRPRRVGGSRP